MRRSTTEDGASAVEYGLLIAGIAALIVLVVVIFGDMVFDMFDTTCTTIDAEATAHSVAADCS